MLTYDCVNRLVSRMNDSDASGEWVVPFGWISTAIDDVRSDFSFERSNYCGISSSTVILNRSVINWIPEWRSGEGTTIAIDQSSHSFLAICKRRSSAKWRRVTVNTIDSYGTTMIFSSIAIDRSISSSSNDILVVCYLIISVKPDAPGNLVSPVSFFERPLWLLSVVETGFAKQLLLFASFPECKFTLPLFWSSRIDSSLPVRSNSPLVKNFKLSTAQEDFEFKKLLFNTVVALSRNPAMYEVKSHRPIFFVTFSNELCV